MELPYIDAHQRPVPVFPLLGADPGNDVAVLAALSLIFLVCRQPSEMLRRVSPTIIAKLVREGGASFWHPVGGKAVYGVAVPRRESS